MKFINVSYMHTESLGILDVFLLFYVCYVYIYTCVWEGSIDACMHMQRPEEDIGYLSMSLSCLDTEFLTEPNAHPFFFQLCIIAMKLWASACPLPNAGFRDKNGHGQLFHI